MDPSTINPDDVLGLVQQFVAMAQGKNWLLAVPLVILAAIAAFRLWIVPRVAKLAWLKTDRGGAVLALIGAAVLAVIGAAAAPGPHNVAQIIVGTVTILLANQLVFGYLKKIVAPDGNARAQEVAVKAGAVATAAAASSTAAADAINAAVKK